MTKAGGSKLVKSMVHKHGSYEAWCEHMAKMGSKGGSKSHVRPFQTDRELARRAGRLGGLGRTGWRKYS